MTTKTKISGRAAKNGRLSRPGAGSVGRTLNARTVAIKWPRGSMRWRFVKNFRKATRHPDGQDMTPAEIASLLGFTEDMARKALRGDAMPDLESWERVAQKLGLAHWSDLFKTPAK